MASNTIVFPISLPKELAREVDSEAKKRAMTRSEYVRDMLRRQLAFASLRDLQRKTSKKAREKGIRSFEDVMRIANEVRHGKSA